MSQIGVEMGCGGFTQAGSLLRRKTDFIAQLKEVTVWEGEKNGA